ncbi:MULTISPECIES: UDP-2,4-diacetamido-2,4,6-trideoxy-beta-L-altropyranose hydrolase [unclassified Thiocapsa]|uniref:UDP-2,4-diacetamido-2,4, 6-trideoxy-beta-L-altropyranose hydrolase n=1 Tax=unclassified Thiocapsa TaxID=2641286 RepID=UPI0035B35FD6
MTVLFRCNASATIGFGHLTRCRALAQALREQDQRCVMVGPDRAYAKPTDHELFEDWIPVPDWPSALADANKVIELAEVHRADWLVLDDYRIDESYQLSVRAAGRRWLQFDGTAHKPLWADLVLVPNIALGESDYVPVLRNPKTKLLCGPRYALLRSEFPPAILRPSERPIEQVLVTFGGGDDRGAIEFVLASLLPSTPPSLQFSVLSGAHNPRNQALTNWIAQHADGRVQLLINPDELAQVFASCDLAIMAGGTSTFEAACCGLPMILVSIADNQTRNSETWEQFGAAIYLGAFPGITMNLLTKTFLDLLRDGDRCRSMAESGKTKIDGRGAQRIVQALLTS